MKVIYIAGPFRASTAWQIEQNVRRAEGIALRLWRQGWAVMCPHTNSRLFHGEAPDEVFIEGTMELLRRCDAIFMIIGWKDSAGAIAEKAEAGRLGLPVFEDYHESLAWLIRNGGTP